jgi:hypothetical protein
VTDAQAAFSQAVYAYYAREVMAYVHLQEPDTRLRVIATARMFLRGWENIVHRDSHGHLYLRYAYVRASTKTHDPCMKKQLLKLSLDVRESEMAGS